MLAGAQQREQAADALAEKTYELVSFLVRVMKQEKVAARFDGTVTYHDSCSGLRELGIKLQPRLLLATVDGLRLKELPGAEICCGFGGTFCVKYPEISDKIVSEKTADVAAIGAGTLLAGDMGCLLNMAFQMGIDGLIGFRNTLAMVKAGDYDGAVSVDCDGHEAMRAPWWVRIARTGG